jgi:hypothetical protein
MGIAYYYRNGLYIKKPNPPCRGPLLLGIFTPVECKKICVIDPSGRDLNPSGKSIFLPFFPITPLEKMTNFSLGK